MEQIATILQKLIKIEAQMETEILFISGLLCFIAVLQLLGIVLLIWVLLY